MFREYQESTGHPVEELPDLVRFLEDTGLLIRLSGRTTTDFWVPYRLININFRPTKRVSETNNEVCRPKTKISYLYSEDPEEVRIIFQDND